MENKFGETPENDCKQVMISELGISIIKESLMTEISTLQIYVNFLETGAYGECNSIQHQKINAIKKHVAKLGEKIDDICIEEILSMNRLIQDADR